MLWVLYAYYVVGGYDNDLWDDYTNKQGGWGWENNTTFCYQSMSIKISISIQ